METEAYLLSKTEMSLLLACSGTLELFGIQMETSDISRRDIIESLHGLVRRDLLIPDHDAFRMDKMLSDCIAIIIKPKFILQIISEDDRIPSLCIYGVNNKLTLMEPDPYSTEHYRIAPFRYNKLFQALAERGLLPIEYDRDVNSSNISECKPSCTIHLFSGKGETIGTTIAICKSENIMKINIGANAKSNSEPFSEREFKKQIAKVLGGIA